MTVDERAADLVSQIAPRNEALFDAKFVERENTYLAEERRRERLLEALVQHSKAQNELKLAS